MINLSCTSDHFLNFQLNKIKHERICLLFISLLLLASYSNTENSKDDEIDFLILSIRWVPSVCILYKAKSYNNFCTLPKNPSVWVLHGLWPQKGETPGPFYCHPELQFDSSVLAPIENNLRLYWPNINGGQTSVSFWKHEWDKHGTCAVILQPLHDQVHFFNSTLSLFNKHNMNSYFSTINILPSNSGLFVSDLNYKLKRVLGRICRIKCSEANGRHYLTEIRLCLNKNLDLIDCPSSREGITNCPADKLILYPSDTDSTNHKIKQLSKLDEENINYYAKIFKLLEIIKFLKWVSL